MLYATVQEYTQAIRRVTARNTKDRKEWVAACRKLYASGLDDTNADMVRARVDEWDKAFIERLQTERKHLRERNASVSTPNPDPQFYRDANGTTWLMFTKLQFRKMYALEDLPMEGDYVGYDMAFVATFAQESETFTQAQVDAMTPLVLIAQEVSE